MKLVTLPTFKNLRYGSDDTVKLPKLQRWAREGRLPGAFKPTPSSDWMVDLDAHDAAIAAAKCQSEPQESRENRLFRLVMDQIRGSVQ